MLAGRPVEDLIIGNNAILHDDGNRCLLKIRIPCESRSVGKSGGFRLIATVDRQAHEIVLLEIFPKVGPFARENITNRDLKVVLSRYIQERDAGELVKMNPDENLEEVFSETI